MKKIINKPEQVVTEMCQGMALAHPELVFSEKYRYITRRKLNRDKVTLISGGGSGHEPAHAGFVGDGMLDAAVCGDVFASPSQIQVYQAIRETKSQKGTLLIIKNYSGDMMNFKNAAYMAGEDGIQVDYVKVDDDIAVQDSLYTVGRRGVAGTVFVHKIAGAAAEAGCSLAEVKAVAEKTAASVKSIGFALTSCTVPAKGTPTFDIGEDEMEYGIGIHGEPGIRREKQQDADTVAERMVIQLLNALGINGQSGEEIAVLVNGLGGTPAQELYVLNRSVHKALAERGIRTAYTLAGNYMTSIDMMGASLSILKLDPELKKYLFAPCNTPALKINQVLEPAVFEIKESSTDRGKEVDKTEKYRGEGKIADEEITLHNMIFMIDCIRGYIIQNEVPFCELDSHAGDGDFGMSVAKGFKELENEWEEVIAGAEDIASFLDACSLIIMEHCGGASGPIWGSAFRAAAKAAEGLKTLKAGDMAEMLAKAVQGIQATGERSFGRGAVPGDKTLIDALVPCADTWAKLAPEGVPMLEIFLKAAEAAEAGAESTKTIVARMGRAGTVGERSLGYPDAGAYALGAIFRELANRLDQASNSVSAKEIQTEKL